MRPSTPCADPPPHTHLPCGRLLPGAINQVKELAARVAAMRERHLEQSTRLLALSRCVYGLEGRFALYSGRG